MAESESKQRGNYDVFAKMFSCFDDVIESAIGIEVHNRNKEGYKPDPTLESVYVLVSAFENGENIVPVKLEIKEFNDKKNTLYVAIALESIKKDKVVRKGDTKNGVTQVPRLSKISLADLFKNINPSDETFLKYVPKQFLEEVKNSDKDYMDAVARGDMETAQKMVDETVKNAGYTIRAYHGTNALFNVFDSGMLGSKNFMATSAYKGFFASKSKETAESYTGLNSMDMASLALNKDAQSKIEEIKEKHNFDAVS